MFANDAKDTSTGMRAAMKHVRISDDGADAVTADGSALALASVTDAGDLAGKLLDAEAIRAFLKGVGTKYRDSQVIDFTLYADGTHVAAFCANFTAQIPLRDETFPSYGQIVANNPLVDSPTNSGAFALSAAFLERIGKALKPFGAPRIHPGRGKRDAVWVIAGPSPSVAGDNPDGAPDSYPIRLLVMPMSVAWPEAKPAVEAAA